MARKVLEAAEPIPPGAVWLDMVEPTVSEDQKVELYLGCKVPSRADPDFTEPPNPITPRTGCVTCTAASSANRKTRPDVTGVTFVLTPTTLVTVRYDPGDAFELFGQKLCKSGAQALHPDAVAVGLVNTIVNRSARALNKVGLELIRSQAPSSRPKATRAAAARSIRPPSTRSAARTRRSRACAKAWCRSSGCCCSCCRKAAPRTRRSRCARRRKRRCATCSR